MNSDNKNRLLFKFVKIYGVLLFLSIMSASALGMLIGIFWPTDSIWFSVAAGALSTWILMKVFIWLSSPLAQFLAYKGNWDQHREDMNFLAALAKPPSHQPETTELDIPRVKTVTLHVVNLPESPIGKYMDVDFYEWLDFKDASGKIERFKFTGTVDPKSLTGAYVEDESYVVPPGIVYKKDSDGSQPN